jgi:hypothetical protein
MKEHWRQLMETIEIYTDAGQQIMSHQEFDEFEVKNHLILPAEYKEFCELLGTGELAETIRVYSPTLEYTRDNKSFLADVLRRLREYIAMNGYFIADTISSERLVTLLESAFIFGDSTPGGDVIFWDLNTYQEIDKSYDIYWLSWETPESNAPIFLGRDFFDLIQNFCYGTRVFDLVPEYMDGSTPDDIPRTFHSFVYRGLNIDGN